MFDVGFSEMLVIGIVALVVIGPERLPKVARTLGHLMGRAQRYVNDVKRDIDREMQVDELRKLQAEMQETARSIETSVTTQVTEVKSELDKAQDTLNQFAQQTEDLTRLDNPLASAPTATDDAQAATEAGMDNSEASQSVELVSEPAPGPESAPAPPQLNQPGPQAQAGSSSNPAAEPDPAAQAKADSGVAAESDAEGDLMRHQLDHVVEDYSEGIMGPNTTIAPPPPPPVTPGGAAGAAVRQVLVHVDVPPVT